MGRCKKKGDGRKSLYICFERHGQDIVDKLYAAGGDGTEIDIVDGVTNRDGTKERLNLRKPFHKETLYNFIENNNYAFVIFDSVSVILTKDMNTKNT